MVLSQFRQKVNFAQCSIYKFSRVFIWGVKGWGGGGDETFPKFAGVLPKVSPKFWQNFMSSKFQKKHNTTYVTYRCVGLKRQLDRLVAASTPQGHSFVSFSFFS